jgi:hypothetical protein
MATNLPSSPSFVDQFEDSDDGDRDTIRSFESNSHDHHDEVDDDDVIRRRSESEEVWEGEDTWEEDLPPNANVNVRKLSRSNISRVKSFSDSITNDENSALMNPSRLKNQQSYNSINNNSSSFSQFISDRRSSLRKNSLVRFGESGISRIGTLDKVLLDGSKVKEVVNKYTASVGGSTFGQTLFNSINCLIGVGILAEPLAFAYAGWLGGTLILLFCGLVTNYTYVVLIHRSGKV